MGGGGGATFGGDGGAKGPLALARAELAHTSARRWYGLTLPTPRLCCGAFRGVVHPGMGTVCDGSVSSVLSPSTLASPGWRSLASG